MQSQGWIGSLLRWIASFLENRYVQVRYTGGITNPKKLVCGVPQGSPISPLLFLLYLAESIRNKKSRAIFSYADDIGILEIGHTVTESVATAQQEVDYLLEWARGNAVSFDPDKSEVIQFPGNRREASVGIHVYGKHINPAEHIRWLGVLLDSQLSFKNHVATWCGKALKIGQHMRRLNLVKRGAAPGPLMTAVNTCVILIATYRLDVWWPGMTRPTLKGSITPPTAHLCNLIDKAINLALRAALPVWKTTPYTVLHRESGIPPARIILEGIRLRLAARLNLLDNRHPLRSRASVCPNVGTLKYKKYANPRLSNQPETQMSRVQRAFRQLPQSSENAEPLTIPVHITYSQMTKEEGLEAQYKWVESISPLDICVYSDGSSEGHGRFAWGYALQRGGTTFMKNQGILHVRKVYDAELLGATAALHAALSLGDN